MKWLFALLLATTPAFAQAPGQTPPRRPPGVEAPAPSGPPVAQETKQERVKRRVRMMRAMALTEELRLDSEGAGKLFPLLEKYDDEFDRLLVERGKLQHQLDAADGKPAKQIDKLIDDSLANQRKFWDLEDKRVAELRKILTPAQVARVLVVLPALERKIQNQLRNAVRPGARMGGKNRPLDDDDDIEQGEQRAKRTSPRSNPRPTRGAPCDQTPYGC
ncbi:MAG TPA: hypothetical protein VFQ65_15775 [Kofleriaceae bacterium]|nr:hypothetical protein [Kofleriaceae bacterium]